MWVKRQALICMCEFLVNLSVEVSLHLNVHSTVKKGQFVVFLILPCELDVHKKISYKMFHISIFPRWTFNFASPPAPSSVSLFENRGRLSGHHWILASVQKDNEKSAGPSMFYDPLWTAPVKSKSQLTFVCKHRCIFRHKCPDESEWRILSFI